MFGTGVAVIKREKFFWFRVYGTTIRRTIDVSSFGGCKTFDLLFTATKSYYRDTTHIDIASTWIRRKGCIHGRARVEHYRRSGLLYHDAHDCLQKAEKRLGNLLNIKKA